MLVNNHKNQKLDLKCKNSSLAINFNFIKEIQKLYKGNYLIRAILLLFFIGKFNQLTVLTRLLHFHCFLDRHPYWPYIKWYGHMAIWPYCLNMATTPYYHMAIWLGIYNHGHMEKVKDDSLLSTDVNCWALLTRIELFMKIQIFCFLQLEYIWNSDLTNQLYKYELFRMATKSTFMRPKLPSL